MPLISSTYQELNDEMNSEKNRKENPEQDSVERTEKDTAPTDESPKQLNLGCGRRPIPEWINLDLVKLEGVDVVANLDDCANTPLPFEDNSIDKFFGSHLIEHIRNPLPMMQELHRIAKPDAECIFLLPYGSSDDAYEDPTHVCQYFLHSFQYFSQPLYWRADYGYRGDWEPTHITLKVSKEKYEGKTQDYIHNEMMHLRNVVIEMMVLLRAVKPIREPKRELQTAPNLKFELK